MTHHSREQYVGPATTSSVWQPARKTGKQASDCWMLFWSMQALSCACAARGEVRVYPFSDKVYVLSIGRVRVIRDKGLHSEERVRVG